ncbi:hypothetical protein [Hugenholtzia roseola]|uniref:hypothetical protein n=1 Tax=Hugenholtzia roseola TaxID=1002 RepID=UPI000402BE24|nr:hypothetical protein [Hugenholtzia roseola]
MRTKRAAQSLISYRKKTLVALYCFGRNCFLSISICISTYASLLSTFSGRILEK